MKGSSEFTTGVKAQTTSIPSSYSLKQNYPNPFNLTTNIEYSLDKPGRVTLNIYNNLGQKVKTLVKERKVAGFHTVQWDGTDLKGRKVGTGIYFYKVEVDGRQFTKKMILIK